MADKKISQLNNATTPLTGAEVLPIVQAGTTVKVSVDNLTKGKTVSATTFDTDVTAAKVTLSGTTLAAAGSNANVNINLTPKGSGTVSTSGFGISIPGFNTPAILSNDANGLVVSQNSTDKLKVRGIGPSGENTQIIIGNGNTLAQPNYSFIADSDTGIFNEPVAFPNQLFLVCGGVAYLSTAAAATIVNDGGADHDFRVESDSNAHALFVEGTNSNVKIGGSAERAGTVGTNHLDVFDGTAPVGTLANGISLYSSSGEAYVMDAAGNATLISPHDAETNEWIFKSKHTPTGKVLRIDVEKLLRFVNNHFGLDAVKEFVEK
jgi:hypothetical protein